MKEKDSSVLPRRAKARKYPARQDGWRRAAKYNYKDMKEGTIKAQEGFARRLSMVRASRGVSAREMSLSLGQGAGYINNIENGNNMPSMAMFFEICEFLEIAPSEFFGYLAEPTEKSTLLINAFDGLPECDQELIIKVIEKIRRD